MTIIEPQNDDYVKIFEANNQSLTPNCWSSESIETKDPKRVRAHASVVTKNNSTRQNISLMSSLLYKRNTIR